MTAESFRPTFTTSAEAAEKRKEEREEGTHHFGDRVSVREGTRPPSRVREVQAPAMKPAPTHLNVARQGHEPTNNGPTKYRLKERKEPQKEPQGKVKSFWEADESRTSTGGVG